MIELHSLLDFLCIGARSAADMAACSGGIQTLFGALCNHITLELRDGTHQRKQQLACRCGGVDLLFQADQMHTAFAEQFHQLNQVFRAAAQAGQALNHHRVALHHTIEQFVQLRTIAFGAGHFLIENVVHAVLCQHIKLSRKVLLFGADTGISEFIVLHIVLLLQKSSFMKQKNLPSECGIPRAVFVPKLVSKSMCQKSGVFETTHHRSDRAVRPMLPALHRVPRLH